MTNLARTARLDVLVEGYVRFPDRNSNRGNVASTVSLVRDADRVIVVDPGIVSDRDVILRRFAELGVSPGDVTDIVLSHHHPDHTLNAAIFPVVPVHDFQWIIDADQLTLRDAHGVQLTPSVQLLFTPGHSPQDITTLVGTPDDVVALTHLWWSSDGPADDPYSHDLEHLHAERAKVLELATLIVPGHGPAFRPNAETLR